MIRKHHFLLITSLLMLLPLVYIIVFVDDPGEFEIFLALFLVMNSILSILFWLNPQKHSFIHKLDGVFAKLGPLLLIPYVLFIKEMNIYLKLLFVLAVFAFAGLFYVSNHYSTKEWCCNAHIFYHFLMHLFGITGLSFAFL